MAGFGMDALGMGVPYLIAGAMVIATLLVTAPLEDYTHDSLQLRTAD
jgi:hypothetical protein